MKTRERLRAERIEVLVVRSELDAAQPEVAGGPLDLVQRLRIEWMYRQETDELLRMRLHECGGIVIHPRRFIDELPVVGHIPAWIGGDIENDRPVDHFHRRDVIVPGMRGRGRLVGTPFAIERGARGFRGDPVAGGMTMNIDDHDF